MNKAITILFIQEKKEKTLLEMGYIIAVIFSIVQYRSYAEAITVEPI
jgi:hypothetical protein